MVACSCGLPSLGSVLYLYDIISLVVFLLMRASRLGMLQIMLLYDINSFLKYFYFKNY